MYKYLNKVRKNIGTVQDVLEDKLNFNEKGAINSYSDFDFTYIVDNLCNEQYTELLKHFVARILLLRTQLNEQVNESDNKNYLDKNLRNNELHCAITKFIMSENKDQKIKNLQIKDGRNLNDTFELNIKLTPCTVDNIITRDIHKKPPEFDSYVLNNRFNMNVSFNNTIVTSDHTDFDLLRIKLKFTVDNNIKESSFKSEIFDLTVLRPNSEHREDFCKEIFKNTIIINYIFGNKIQCIRMYSLSYLITDLLGILFKTNQPLNTIFLWADKKYDKRIVRLGLLIPQYIDELDAIDNNRRKNFFKMLCLMSLIHQLLENLQRFKEGSNNNLLEKDDILRGLLINSMDITDNINPGINEDINANFITYLLDNPIDKNVINLVLNRIKEDDFVIFLLYIIIIFMKKIFIENDIKWCTDFYYGENSNKHIDLCDFQTKFINFIHYLASYLFLGTANFSNMFEDFIEENNIPELVNIYHDQLEQFGSSIISDSYPENMSINKPTNISNIPFGKETTKPSTNISSKNIPLKKEIENFSINIPNKKIPLPMITSKIPLPIISKKLNNYGTDIVYDNDYINKSVNMAKKDLVNKDMFGLLSREKYLSIMKKIDHPILKQKKIGDTTFYKNCLKMKKSLQENYTKDVANKYSSVEYCNKQKKYVTIERIPKIIKPEIYNSDILLDKLVDEHAEIIEELFGLKSESNYPDIPTISTELYDLM
jgi:hypothetical protein